MTNKIVLFGATGFTGQLTAKALVKQGAKPVLVGRNRNKLINLANELGGLEIAVADISSVQSLAAVLDEGDVLITTVGPFTRYGETALEAAISKKAHYLDSTGEPGFIRKVFEEYGPKAKAAGVTLLTAFGYDYVPGNCVAAAALDMVDGASRVDVGYFVSGDGFAASQGTQASVMQAMLEPGVFFRQGRLLEKVFAAKVRRFTIQGNSRPAAEVPGSEHLALPLSYPSLQEVNTFLGWFGIASYLMPVVTGLQALLLKVPGYHGLLDKVAAKLNNSQGQGPDEGSRAKNATEVQAIAYNAQGQALSEALLLGVNPYDFTAAMLAWAAIQGLQQGYKHSGALGPVAAFGNEALIAGCTTAGLELTKRKL